MIIVKPILASIPQIRLGSWVSAPVHWQPRLLAAAETYWILFHFQLIPLLLPLELACMLLILPPECPLEKLVRVGQ